MKEQIEEIKDCIDSVYGCDCAYYGVEGMAIAQALYNAGYRKQSEWISVEDRLPEMYEDVLCYDGNYCCVDFICSDGTWCDAEIHTNEITHWMPLPEPPEMKGGE